MSERDQPASDASRPLGSSRSSGVAGLEEEGQLRQRAEVRVRAWLETAGVAWEPGARSGEVVVTLPGEHKLKTVASLVVGPVTTSISAFVIRHPDENEGRFHASLLRRNLRLRGVAYGIDTDGDVYVTGEVPTSALAGDPDEADQADQADEAAEAAEADATLDRLLGAVLAAADDAFDELLVIGFLTSMRKEWAWRVSRGEPTTNLEAFRPLLEGEAGH